MLSSNVDNIAKQQAVITSLVKEISQLKTQNSDLRKKVDTLEERVDDMEQFSKLNDVIVSGLDIRPRTYAAAARAAMAQRGPKQQRLPPDEEDRMTAEMEVVAFLHSKGILINSDNIEACHPLLRKGTDNPAVILRFANRKHKINLLRQGKALKGTHVYLNEHLTKRNGEIFKKARYLRKLQKIQQTWTANCKVFIKLNGGCPEQAKVVYIRSLEELDNYQ